MQPLSKNWIKGAIKKPGQLHRDLGVPQGEKIPQSKIASAAQGSGKTAQRARFAQTLKKFAKGGSVDMLPGMDKKPIMGPMPSGGGIMSLRDKTQRK